jgi:hypothetical protein
LPKSPFLALRIEAGEIQPVSCGYRVGWGKTLLAAIDRTPQRVDQRYVRLWSWMVLRMHWLGVWLAPVSLYLLWRTRQRAGLFLWLFGAWAFLVPGIFNFGPIHEFEWYRWEFAAGFGFAAALGTALGTLARGPWSALALTLALALTCQAGLAYLKNFGRHFNNPKPGEVLGLSFDSQAWLLRHGGHLRLQEADLRVLAWISANPARGDGCFIATTGPPEPWGILFESTAMALADIRAIGHRLPPKADPIGVPPYRISEPFQRFLQEPTDPLARELGIDWVLLRSDDAELERRLTSALRLVYCDGLSSDGKTRLLFTGTDSEMPRPPSQPLPGARYQELDFGPIPPATAEIQLEFTSASHPSPLPGGKLPPVRKLCLAVPVDCQALMLSYLDRQGACLERRSLAIP